MKNAKFKSLANFLTLVFTATALVGMTNSAWGKSTERKVKDAIDDVSDSLKKAVDKLGDDAAAVQDYLENYHWKGIIQSEAASGAASLSHLHLNGRGKAILAKPGERIQASVECHLDRTKCQSLGYYRVIVGLKGQGAQASVCNYLGAVAGKSEEKFTLVAPSEPGIYQIRFRLVENFLESSAMKAWYDDKGKEPDAKTTIGILFVKP